MPATVKTFGIRLDRRSSTAATTMSTTKINVVTVGELAAGACTDESLLHSLRETSDALRLPSHDRLSRR
jgi:hypothetical protein